MYAYVKNYLFKKPAEEAHYFTTSSLKALFKFPFAKTIFRKTYEVKDPSLHRRVFDLDFKNPVGLAAGFDKNAEFIHEFEALGFGFIEVGTVTPMSQQGNDKPRLFRLIEDEAIINRMGFNNKGVYYAAEQLKNRPNGLIIGGNIGKNKVTPNEEAINDYLKCFEALHELVDYFVVNVSSPNTPGLRELQDKEPLHKLLTTLQAANEKYELPKPILLKIAPDLTDGQLSDIIELTKEIGLQGIVATNTTIDREGLHATSEELDDIGAGGLSGAPVFEKSTHVLKVLRNALPDLPIIAVGGICSAEDALEKISAGATLLQVYSGLIYKGPALIKEINQALIQKVKH